MAINFCKEFFSNNFLTSYGEYIMREITIQEMTLVYGATDDGKGGSTSRDFKTALITLAVEKSYEIIESQIDYYTTMYESA